ncbi:MAG: spermidine/putrescine ABC transporter substrate-binding protein [Desulfobulbaceae bacterium]|nr:spermidine/putrescine ABC transporter substrate-binding protein [Desulfobulbaceae bacterium]
MLNRRSLIIVLFIFVVVGILGYKAGWFATKQQELNVLAWTGYDEPELVKPFEKKYGVKVNFKTFVGGDAMFSLLTQSKSVYDVVVVDPEYIQKLHALDQLRPLDPATFDMSDYFKPFQKFPLSWIDDKLYSIVVEYGANALVYNTKHITAAEANSFSILFDPKLKGRIGVWDWYLPIMGVVSRGLGHKTPFDLTEEQFEAVKHRLMELRPQIRAIHGTFPELMTSLANEDTWIVPGGAGWVSSALQQQGKPYDWTVPEEGGVMWVDSLVIPTDAPHPELAKLYLQWMMSSEAQAALSQKKAFHANVPNQKAYALMPDDHKKRLKWVTPKEVEAVFSKLAVRTLPVQQSEKMWQDGWEAFKAAE